MHAVCLFVCCFLNNLIVVCCIHIAIAERTGGTEAGHGQTLISVPVHDPKLLKRRQPPAGGEAGPTGHFL